MKKIFFLMLLLIVCLAGCASQPVPSKHYAPKSSDELRKTFAIPVENQANIYIYRDGFWGHNSNTEVFLDGKILGKNLGWTYLFVVVPQGIHKITSHLDNYASIEINFEGGKNYFIRETIDYHRREGVKIEKVSNKEGQKGVLECTLVDTVQY